MIYELLKAATMHHLWWTWSWPLNHFNQSHSKDFVHEADYLEALSAAFLQMHSSQHHLESDRWANVDGKERMERKLKEVVLTSSLLFSRLQLISTSQSVQTDFKPIIKRSSVRTWIRTRLISAHWNCTINRKIIKLETLLKDAPSRIESNGTSVLFHVKRTVWLFHKFGVQQKLAVNKCLVIENICHRNCKLSEIWLLCVKVRSARTEHLKWKGEKIRKLADCIIAWLGCVNVLNR